MRGFQTTLTRWGQPRWQVLDSCNVFPPSSGTCWTAQPEITSGFNIFFLYFVEFKSRVYLELYCTYFYFFWKNLGHTLLCYVPSIKVKMQTKPVFWSTCPLQTPSLWRRWSFPLDSSALSSVSHNIDQMDEMVTLTLGSLMPLRLVCGLSSTRKAARLAV